MGRGRAALGTPRAQHTAVGHLHRHGEEELLHQPRRAGIASGAEQDEQGVCGGEGPLNLSDRLARPSHTPFTHLTFLADLTPLVTAPPQIDALVAETMTSPFAYLFDKGDMNNEASAPRGCG